MSPPASKVALSVASIWVPSKLASRSVRILMLLPSNEPVTASELCSLALAFSTSTDPSASKPPEPIMVASAITATDVEEDVDDDSEVFSAAVKFNSPASTLMVSPSISAPSMFSSFSALRLTSPPAVKLAVTASVSRVCSLSEATSTSTSARTLTPPSASAPASASPSAFALALASADPPTPTATATRVLVVSSLNELSLVSRAARILMSSPSTVRLPPALISVPSKVLPCSETELTLPPAVIVDTTASVSR